MIDPIGTRVQVLSTLLYGNADRVLEKFVSKVRNLIKACIGYNRNLDLEYTIRYNTIY